MLIIKKKQKLKDYGTKNSLERVMSFGKLN